MTPERLSHQSVLQFLMAWSLYCVRPSVTIMVTADQCQSIAASPFTNVINLNSSIDKKSHAQLNVGLDYLSISNLQRLRRRSLGINK